MYKKNKIIAIIPARKNSKGIKEKNIFKIAGKPLISYTINCALKSKYIDDVYVTTDGDKIAKVSKQYGAKIIKRPKALSNDIIMPDAAVVHAAKSLKSKKKIFDFIVFLQPTTPLRQKKDLENAIKKTIDGKYDTVFASVDYNVFLWKNKNNRCYPANFNPYRRKRRQKINEVNETGSFYITSVKSLFKYNNRFGKKVTYYLCNFLSIFEVDTMEELQIINLLVKSKIASKLGIQIPKKI